MKKINIAINGFGRIGRVLFRLAQKRKEIKVVGINDISNIEYAVYMLKYDSTHGNFKKKIEIKNKNLFKINENEIRFTSINDISKIDWKSIDVDFVVESTGQFLTEKEANQHILSGAKKVIITAPPKDESIPMFIMGVNNELYNNQKIVSNASCTTNCLAPLAKIIHDKFQIIEGLMSTVHATTSTQKTVDGFSFRDWRGGRGILQNIIPSSTGAASAVGKIIPELRGKLTGIAFRVPISNVSVVDLTVRIKKSVTYSEICETIKEASRKKFKNIIGYTEEDVVSSDFNGEEKTSILDVKSGILLNKNFVKLVSWYDNETGYSSKVLDLIEFINKSDKNSDHLKLKIK